MTLINIQSQDYRDLLDTIDRLRSQGVDQYVGLPEIIVCGDQSSGKSSVLEAISGLSFPTKDNLCTRFPTELILRRHPVANIHVSIVPHHSRGKSEKNKLLAFTAHVDASNPDIGPVVEAAKAAMSLDDVDYDGEGTPSVKHFSKDVLRIELSGPTQQHLTLVDLPGLFQAGSAEQSADEAPVVRELVKSYMKRPRSIILSVVSAAYDFANQAVTQIAREVDPRGARTMGLITKPDKLDRNSDSERAFVKTAENRDVVLQLGWHVLKNRSYEMRNATAAERDEAETKFFTASDSAWASVNPAHLGIDNLRPRLSTVLQDQIISQLPTMLHDIDTHLEECKRGLGRLGAPRVTIHEQRQYLSRVSRGFSDLMAAAVNGSYTDAGFFGSVLQLRDDDDGGAGGHGVKNHDGKEYQRRLRAVVQNRLTRFGKDIHAKGRTRVIVSDDTKLDGSKTKPIRRGDYINEVKDIISKSRGRELPGTFNPLVVGDLFRDQCKKWGQLANECIESVLQSSFAAITAALTHITVDDTAEKILHGHIIPAVDALKKDMVCQVDMLMLPHTKGHPITYNHYLTETVQDVRNKRHRDSLEKALLTVSNEAYILKNTPVSTVLNILMANKEPNMERVAASDAIDYMEAYYKVALKSFVDNVSVLVVEQCLISKLPSLFMPDMIYSISDEDVARFASETSYATAERARLTKKKATLESGQTELRRLHEHHLPVPGGTLESEWQTADRYDVERDGNS